LYLGQRCFRSGRATAAANRCETAEGAKQHQARSGNGDGGDGDRVDVEFVSGGNLTHRHILEAPDDGLPE